MHFEIKGVELDLINKVAVEDNLSLDEAMKKILSLAGDSKRDKALGTQMQTSLLETFLKHLETIDGLAFRLHQEAEGLHKEVQDLL